MVIVRSVVGLAASLGWLLFQMDVHNAFIHGDLVKEVYIQILEGFANQGKKHMIRKIQNLKTVELQDSGT